MSCPSCSCSTSFEVTILVGKTSRTYQECVHCGNLWSLEADEKSLVEMYCPNCIEATGVNVWLSHDANPPELTCRACGALWNVRAMARDAQL